MEHTRHRSIITDGWSEFENTQKDLEVCGFHPLGWSEATVRWQRAERDGSKLIINVILCLKR